MTAIDNVTLDNVIVHKIGNPTRGEALKLSANALTLNDEVVKALLTKYFLTAFNENEQYTFTHTTDLHLDEVYYHIHQLFNEPASFILQSKKIAKLLYAKSTHARVKEGELYVTMFNNLPLGNTTHKAVGIFKSETKETFLKVFNHGKNWEVVQEQGIDINKLDKGCLIFNTNQHNGYVACIVDDTNKTDTRYWVNDFLQVTPLTNNYHYTHHSMDMCKLFIANEYADKFDITKSDQADMLNRSADYFKTKEKFNLHEFAEEVIHHADVVETFMDFKQQYECSRNFIVDEEYDIDVNAVKKQSKIFKSVIKLDKNFHLYIHGNRNLIEKGYDEKTGKKFYKLFYDEES
jgi:37-kD nucleoid-associated bacterial protein